MYLDIDCIDIDQLKDNKYDWILYKGVISAK